MYKAWLNGKKAKGLTLHQEWIHIAVNNGCVQRSNGRSPKVCTCKAKVQKTLGFPSSSNSIIFPKILLCGLDQLFSYNSI